MYVVPASDWLLIGIFFIGLVWLIAFSEYLIRNRRLSPEKARKSIHLVTGLLVLPTPYLFDSPVPLWIMSAVFLVANAVALATNGLLSLTASHRRSLGTLCFPVSYSLLLGLFWNQKPVIVIAMSSLAIGDALAAFVGKGINRPHRIVISPEPKSLEGSVAMFVSTSLLAATALFILPDAPRLSPWVIGWGSLAIGICSTFAEVVSYRGSDNLTVPLLAAFVASFFVRYPATETMTFWLGFALASALALVSLRLKFLNEGGAVALFLMGTLIFAIGGWTFGLPIVLFFLSSSLLSRLGRRGKKSLRAVFQKHGRRDLGQVVANGLVPTILTLAWYIDLRPMWYALFLASIAAVTADTWATEIGVLSPWEPRSIRNGRTVPRGSSGGISLLGLAGATAGSASIAVVATLTAAGKGAANRTAFWVGVSGFVAHLVDSWLGATFQAQYVCSDCGQLSEKRVHCGTEELRPFRGLPWIDNDMVNAACAISGPAVLFAVSFVNHLQPFLA